MRLAGLGLALLAATAAAEERITHESGLGNPYGVARVSVRFAHRVPDTPLPLLSEKSGRAHYPTLHLATASPAGHSPPTTAGRSSAPARCSKHTRSKATRSASPSPTSPVA